MSTSRKAATATIAILMLAAIVPSSPAYAGSADVARGISGAIYAGAGARLCGVKCAKVGYRIGTGVFDRAQEFTTTVGPKIKWPKKKPR